MVPRAGLQSSSLFSELQPRRVLLWLSLVWENLVSREVCLVSYKRLSGETGGRVRTEKKNTISMDVVLKENLLCTFYMTTHTSTSGRDNMYQRLPITSDLAKSVSWLI